MDLCDTSRCKQNTILETGSRVCLSLHPTVVPQIEVESYKLQQSGNIHPATSIVLADKTNGALRLCGYISTDYALLQRNESTEVNILTSPRLLSVDFAFYGTHIPAERISCRFVLKAMESVKPKPKQCSVGKNPVYMRLQSKGDSVAELITRRLRNSVDMRYLVANLCLSLNCNPTGIFRLKDKLLLGRNQPYHRQRARLRHHILGNSEPTTTGMIQTSVDCRVDWNTTAASTTLRPKETCATSELELACEKSGPCLTLMSST
ncbi:hypothetical protein CSKR_109337 [Clonorchis sinensis]|uniref:Uncharacterized protein n=1 Tax=Clonorchis sinensis TaxID=79923 RepID=A0A3R7FJ41_CLOSI|nr:hypothetical protein CSKR_109337 [Clonorchis sinensis]